MRRPFALLTALVLIACSSDEDTFPNPPATAGNGGAGGAIAGSGGAGGTSAGSSGAGGSAAGNAGAGGSAGTAGTAGSGDSGSAGAAGDAGAGGSGGAVGAPYVTYCKVNFADATQALKFRTELNVTDAQVDVSLTSLTVAATSTSNTSGDAYQATSPRGADGSFSWALGTVMIAGDANAISGSDIELASAVIAGKISDKICAELNGALTKPFALDLNAPGDICILLPAPTDGTLPAAPSDADYAACAGGAGGAGGAAGASGSSGQSGEAGAAGQAGAAGEAGAAGAAGEAGSAGAAGSGGAAGEAGAAGQGGAAGDAGASGASGQSGAAGSGPLVCPPVEFKPLSQCDSPTKSACVTCFCDDVGTTSDCKTKWEACLADEGCSKAVYCGNQGCTTGQCASLAGSGLSKALAVKTCRENACKDACTAGAAGAAGASGSAGSAGSN